MTGLTVLEYSNGCDTKANDTSSKSDVPIIEHVTGCDPIGKWHLFCYDHFGRASVLMTPRYNVSQQPIGSHCVDLQNIASMHGETKHDILDLSIAGPGVCSCE